MRRAGASGLASVLSAQLSNSRVYFFFGVGNGFKDCGKRCEPEYLRSSDQKLRILLLEELRQRLRKEIDPLSQRNIGLEVHRLVELSPLGSNVCACRSRKTGEFFPRGNGRLLLEETRRSHLLRYVAPEIIRRSKTTAWPWGNRTEATKRRRRATAPNRRSITWKAFLGGPAPSEMVPDQASSWTTAWARSLGSSAKTQG